MLGIPAERRSCASRPRPARACPSCSTRSIERIPPPDGDADAPLQALIFDSLLRPVPRRGLARSRVMNGTLHDRRQAAVHAGRRHPRRRGGRRAPARRRRRSPTLGPGEVGYLIAGIKDVGEARSGETVTDARAPGAEPLDGLPRPEADGVLRPLSRSTATSTPTCARRSRSCGSTTRRSPTSPRRRARSASASAAASSACCTWRSSASGSSASSTCASSPPRRTSSTACTRTDGERRGRRQPVDDAAAERDRGDRGAVRSTVTILTPDRLHRHAHGAVPEPAGRDAEDGVPLAGAGRARATGCRSPRSSSTSSTR